MRGNTFEVILTRSSDTARLLFVGRAGRPSRSGRADTETSPRPTSSGRRARFAVVPSAIIHGDLLYMINDMQSILTVVEAKTGKAVYQIDRRGHA